MKRAKQEIHVKKSETQIIKQMQTVGGIANVTKIVEFAVKEYDTAARKQEEFPDDEQVAVEVETAESKVEAQAEALDKIVKSKRAPIGSEKKLKMLRNKGKERKEYNQMFNESKRMLKEGKKEEVQQIFDSMKENFEEAEVEYVKTKADPKKTPADIAEAGQKFESATITYNASLTTKFDLEEQQEKEENRLEIEIPEEKKKEI